jgi:hypothetical protein
MTQSTNGPEPAIETAIDQARAIITSSDGPQLNPEDFIIDQSDLDTPVTKAVLTSVAIRRPTSQEFIRTHPTFRPGPLPFVHLQANREYYIVKPELRSQLRPREYSLGVLFLAVNRADHVFFWPVVLRSPLGKVSDWNLSRLEAAEKARDQWVQVYADMALGAYAVSVAEEELEPPVWPSQSPEELFHLATRRRVIDSLDHAAFRQLRGRV